MDEFDDIFAEDAQQFEQKYESEVKAFERAGPSSKLHEMVSGQLGNDKKKFLTENATPEDRFLVFTDATARRLMADGLIEITEKDITTMLEKTANIVGLRYKNPTAYILGYVATNGGKNIKKKNILNIFSILPKIGDEYGITPPDIVRYARYWQKIG